MSHSDLVDVLLKMHVTVLLASLAAFYAYSDRTDGFAASLKGTTEVLTELRRRIAKALGDKLTPIFESPGSVPSPVLGPDGGTYVERAVNPVGSEIYRETIRDFVEERADWICDYHSLLSARDRWCFWAGAFRNLLLGLFSWQLITCGLLFADKVSALELPVWLMCAISTATGLAVASSIVTVVFRLLHYRTIVNLRLKYAEL